MEEVERNKCMILIMQELIKIDDDNLINYMLELAKNEPKSVQYSLKVMGVGFNCL